MKAIAHTTYGPPNVLQLKYVRQLPKLNFTMPSKKEFMAVLRELIEAGKINPVVDRTFSLEEVSEAIRYLQEGHPQGKVVITVGKRSNSRKALT